MESTLCGHLKPAPACWSIIFSSCLLLLTHAPLCGQGIVDFENGIDPSLAISTNSIPGGPATGLISGPAAYYFALFSAPSGTTDPGLFTFTGNYATNLPPAGRISSGGYPYQAIPGTPPYETVSLLVRGWSANIGSDVSALNTYLANPTFAAWYGQSQIATLPLGDPNGISPPPLLFGGSQDPGFTQIVGFTLEVYEVPEPCLLLIAVFGAIVAALSRKAARR